MRFPIAAIFFLITSFIFFIGWAVSSFFINTIKTNLQDQVTALGNSQLNEIWTTLPTAFGVICLLLFVIGIVLLFFLDATRDEPEYFWREE